MPDSTTPASPNELRSVALFVLSILASAFLIFLVQPMVGKRILPWFGGTSAVWMVCLAFYQTTLFLGYAYAHLLIRFATPAIQVGIHAILVVLALSLQPVLPGDLWRPDGIDSPVLDILAMLGANVAIPFLILASTGPLVQAWFARLHPTRSPYPLYAVSNAGSLLALLAFPFFLEPRLGLSEIGGLWTVAFVVTVFLVLGCGLLMWRGSPTSPSEAPDDDAASEPVDGFRVMLWLLLSATGVMLLMGVTNRLCLDIASVPFLWILPLALYLLTLILCFGSERFFNRPLFLGLGALMVLKTIGVSLWSAPFRSTSWYQTVQVSLGAEIASYGLLLFAMTMLMHGELYRLRPGVRSLTAFYLCVAGGGALGGLFVGLVAPVIFDDYHELVIGLALAWFLVPLTAVYDRIIRTDLRRNLWPSAVVSTSSVVMIAFVSVWVLPTEFSADVRMYQERTFFGVMRVDDFHRPSAQRVLTHGTTIHGVQFLSTGQLRTPTTYYGHATPIGLLMSSRAEKEETRIGVIGLGAGTLATYGRPGDSFRFYEIDESVIQLASAGGPFSFLEMSAGTIETVPGDARLSLARERDEGTSQSFDILVVDAFSSDGIPVHLLTREAFARYAEALSPNGLIALHVSTKHLDLSRQVAVQGQDAGFGVLALSSVGIPKFKSQRTEWVFLTPGSSNMESMAERILEAHALLGVAEETLTLTESAKLDHRGLKIWTDEQSDVFSLLKNLR